MRTRRQRPVGLAVVVGLALATVVVSSAPVRAATPSGWSAPRPLPGAQDPQSVSCPTATDCLATDSAGHAFRFDGTSRSGPTPVDTGCAGQQDCGLIVSCGAATFCVAMDLAGQTFAYNGTWSKSTALQSADQFAMFTAVSCPQAGVCVAVDDSGDAFTYQGAAWSAPEPTAGASSLAVLSCPTAQFCAGASADATSDLAIRQGTTWRTGPSLPLPAPMGGSEPNNAAALSCTAATFCAALDTFGHAFTYRGKGWSGPARLDDNENGSASVSCPTSTFCAAVDGIGNAFHFDGKGWAKQTSLRQRDAGFNSVSCPTKRFCVALDSANAYLIYRG